MSSLGIPEVVARLILTYLAEAFLGIAMYFIFRYFSRVYIRRFLRTWARSWLAFAVATLSAAALITIKPGDEFSNSIGLPLSFIGQLGSFLHIIYILIGSYQLVFKKPINRKLHNSILIATVVLALITVLAFSQNPALQGLSYFVRAGSRSTISGLGFLFAGLVVWTNPKFTKGVGQKILTFSFLAFSVYQFFYLFILITNQFGEGANVSVPGSPGLINLLMIAMMSMGMVMWLLEDERERLHQANKDLDSFLYSTSHDLRAPISSILGLTYISKLELKEEKAREYMDLIEQRVKKLNMILTDILNLSKTKKLEVSIRQLNFKEIQKEALAEIQYSQDAIRFDLDTGEQNIFYSDTNQIKIILRNLITNAVKYHRLRQEDPYIKIRFKRTGDKVEISVEDNGQGIPKESLSKIFDMFYRASSDSEGTGLGLFIVKEALSKIKGTIEVDSVFGKGSTFTITLENA